MTSDPLNLILDLLDDIVFYVQAGNGSTEWADDIRRHIEAARETISKPEAKP